MHVPVADAAKGYAIAGLQFPLGEETTFDRCGAETGVCVNDNPRTAVHHALG